MDEPKDIQNNTPKETNTPVDPLPEVEIPNLRTYKGDIGHTVATDKITTAKILMSEQKERDKREKLAQETSVSKPKNMFALIFGVLFGLGALGLIGFFGYTQFKEGPNIVQITNEDLFVFSFDEKKFVNAQMPKDEVFQEVENIFEEAANQENNVYTDIIFYETDLITEEEKRITSAQFFTIYDIRLPFDISRSISRDFVYGIYHDRTKTEPFLIIGLADYEKAFSSMFLWEDTLASDFEVFFPAITRAFNPPVVEIATSTDSGDTGSTTPEVSDTASTTQEQATTTPIVEETITNEMNRRVEFTDIIYSNKDTRTARDEDGVPFFYYAFIERDKILFAQDPALLGEITRKIKERQLIR